MARSYSGGKEERLNSVNVSNRLGPSFILDGITKAPDNIGHHAAKTRHKRGNATVAPIRYVVACRGDIRVRGLVLRLTVWPNLVRGCAALAPREDLPHCA
jgi:hypothetical protein